MHPTPSARLLSAILPALVCAALAAPGAASADPEVRIIDLLSLRTDDLGAWERFQRTSDSAPLTLEELEKLAAAGVGPQALVEMMRTRKVATVADADTLLRLKKAGASDDMLAALSAYAMKPNTGFDLFVHLDVTSPDTMRQAPTLYIEAWHAEEKRAVAFFHADLQQGMSRGLEMRVTRDDSDPMLPRTVRSIDFAGRVDTRKPGTVSLRVLVSKSPGLRRLDGLPPAEAQRVRTFEVKYPAVSLEHRCRLDLALERDSLMKDAYTLRDGALDCRWE